ncbi:HTTM domain-containing protein [Streptomyces sp. NPDC005526]|uniref:HTTM domain-containing protein n=1 Tax=Streptomyces sp. NPDC005526 TaxID=3156885 RepID=UPI0033B8087A
MAPYQAAVVRIGISFTWLAFLLREWNHSDELYGPGSPWSWGMSRQLIATNHAFTALLWSDSRLWFEIVYAATIAVSVMLLVGWRTRTTSLLFMIGVLTLQNRNIFVGDGGDMFIHITAIYLVFVRCGEVWSLDSRKSRQLRQRGDEVADGRGDVVGTTMWGFFVAVLASVTALGKLGMGWGLILWGVVAVQAAWWLVRRYAGGEPRTVMAMVGNVLHAGALLVIVGEVCLIYATAGWSKILGSRWEDGTALYYVFHNARFTPWPTLSHALGNNSLLVMVITYGTVLIEVAFPFTLFNRRVKNVSLALLIGMHLGIGILLGLPFFALTMVAADSVFLPTAFLRWTGDRIVRAVPQRGAVRPAASPETAAEVCSRRKSAVRSMPSSSALGRPLLPPSTDTTSSARTTRKS